MVDALTELRPSGNSQNYDDEEYQRLAQALIDSSDESTTATRLRALSQKLLDDAFFVPYSITPIADVRAGSVRDVVVGRYGRTFRTAYLAG
jgi:peptide/nickel transport system substrate-binding protein